MAHFAKLDQNNMVIAVLVGRDEDDENELTKRTGDVYKQTSYNTVGGIHLLGGTPFRKNYAGIGSIYDSERDAFYGPKPYPSWILNEESCIWEPPIPYPAILNTTGFNPIYTWNEKNQSWE